MMPRWITFLFAWAAIVGLSGWTVLITLWGWWTFQPVVLPSVAEPIPILNFRNEVSVGQNLLLRLEVNKVVNLNAISSARYIACDSGNLITLTAAPIRLPIGSYSVITQDIVIPAKATVGDRCVYSLDIVYQINPIRQESVHFESEPFIIIAKS